MKTNTKPIEEAFERIKNAVGSRINYGGCLFAAYAVYLKAKEHGIETSIIQINVFEKEQIQNNKDFLLGKRKNADSGNHFLLKYGGEIYDTDGTHYFDMDEGIYEGVYSTYDNVAFLEIKGKDNINRFCKSALKQKNIWNRTFDRKEGTNKIYEAIGINLKKLA